MLKKTGQLVRRLAGCGDVEVIFFPLLVFSSAHLLAFLFAHFIRPRPLSPASLSLTLFVYPSACCPHLTSCPSPSPRLRSVTGEFPELITRGYPRVQRGPAHLQAQGSTRRLSNNIFYRLIKNSP